MSKSEYDRVGDPYCRECGKRAFLYKGKGRLVLITPCSCKAVINIAPDTTNGLKAIQLLARL